MLRDSLTYLVDHDPHFRWRGEGVSRIENLSDIVFALSLGLLISGGRPTTFDGLTDYLWTILPVGAAFFLMLGIWNAHFTFFRRYGLADATICRINALLLLLILFLAYPLRFVFDSLFAFVAGKVFGDWSAMQAMELMSYQRAGQLMALFCLGFVLVYILIHWMYAHAKSQREMLDLDDQETIITRRSLWRYRVEILLGLTAGLTALFTMVGPFAGFFLVFNWPLGYLIDRSLPLGEKGAETGPQSTVT